MASFPISLTDDTKSAAKSIFDALDRMGNKLESIGKGFDKLGNLGKKSFTELAGHISNIGNFFLNAGRAAFDFGKTVISASLDAAKYLGGVIDSGTRSRFTFQAITGSIEETNKSLELSLSLSKRLGRPFDEISQSIAGIERRGGSGDQATIITSILSDLDALGGYNTKQIEEVFSSSLNTGFFKGAEAVEQLSKSGVDLTRFFDALGPRIGKTTDELYDLAKAGKLQRMDAGPALDALSEALVRQSGGSRPGDIGEKLARGTLDGFVGRFKAGLEGLFLESSKNASSSFSRGLESLNVALDKLFANQGIKDKFGDLFTKLADKLPGIATQTGVWVDKLLTMDWDAFGGKVSKFVEDLGKAVGFMGDLVSLFEKFDKFRGSNVAETLGLDPNGSVGKSLNSYNENNKNLHPGQIFSSDDFSKIADFGKTIGNFWSDLVKPGDKSAGNNVLAPNRDGFSTPFEDPMDPENSTAFSKFNDVKRDDIHTMVTSAVDSMRAQNKSGYSTNTVSAPIQITIDGSKNSAETADKVYYQLDQSFSSMVDRHMRGSGA